MDGGFTFHVDIYFFSNKEKRCKQERSQTYLRVTLSRLFFIRGVSKAIHGTL